MYDVSEARELLWKAGLFFEDEDDRPTQVLNMNDTWAWASADAEEVTDEELPRVAELFYRYGWCGILYWASEKHGGFKSEFKHYNRFIEFVRNEERIRAEIPDSSQRAYSVQQYTVGETKPTDP